MLDKSNSLRALNARHQFHPMIHPQMSAERPPQIIVEAEGCMVTDIDGRRLIDGVGGLWNVNVGHNRREVKDAIVAQMEKVSYYSSFARTTTLPPIALSAKVCEMAAEEGIDKVLFSANGSDAVETALKLARQYWKLVGEPMRTKFLSLKNGYHGVHFGGLSVNGSAGYRTAYEPLVPGCFQVESPLAYRNPFSEDPAALTDAIIGQIERLIAFEGPATIAAFIAEPVLGAGGVIVPPADFWPRLRAVCDRHGILLISDEVVTGFGRSGSMFGARGWGVKPDMMCLAKGISSGYVPLGATALSKRVTDAWYGERTPEGVIMHGYTSTGHPVACAAALACLDIVEKEDLPGNAARMGARLLAGLTPLAQSCSVVGEVRGKGLMVGLDLVADKNTRTPLPPPTGIAERIAAYAQDEGAMVRPAGSVIILSPPLVINEAEVDGLIAALTAACARYDAEARA